MEGQLVEDLNHWKLKKCGVAKFAKRKLLIHMRLLDIFLLHHILEASTPDPDFEPKIIADLYSNLALKKTMYYPLGNKHNHGKSACFCWVNQSFLYSNFRKWLCQITRGYIILPRCSMYGIFTYIYPNNDP